mgnify:CR=1 FL=1
MQVSELFIDGRFLIPECVPRVVYASSAGTGKSVSAAVDLATNAVDENTAQASNNDGSVTVAASVWCRQPRFACLRRRSCALSLDSPPTTRKFT